MFEKILVFTDKILYALQLNTWYQKNKIAQKKNDI
jgi:hypothetical protein